MPPGRSPGSWKEARAGSEQVPAVVEAVHLCRLVFLGEDAGTHGVKVGILHGKAFLRVSRLARKRSQRLRKAWSIIHSPLGKASLPPSWFSPIVYPKTLALSMPFLGGALPHRRFHGLDVGPYIGGGPRPWAAIFFNGRAHNGPCPPARPSAGPGRGWRCQSRWHRAGPYSLGSPGEWRPGRW